MESKIFAGSGGGGSKGGHISPNSIFSDATLRVLDLISEGQIGGLVDGAKSVYFDDVPVQNKSGTYNYEGVSIDWNTGTPDQPVLKNFGNVITPMQVGQEVKNGYPIIKAIPNNDADEVRVVVSLPSLMYQDSKGNIGSTSVKFKFDIAINNTGYWHGLGTYEISGKQNSQYSKSYAFKLPQKDANDKKPAQWLIRMTRLSEDSNERYQARTIFDSMYIVSNSKLNYPYSAVVGISVNAQNLGNIPTRSYLVDGMIIKIPSNYDQATNTYNGIWDGTFKMAVSDNPAWILYALLTNPRWGLGTYIKNENINKAKLYEIGRYCDELVDDGYGKKEKRFSINTQIQQRSDAYRLISDISAVFRGMAYWAGGMANFTCDMPTEASMLYTPANVINGTFTYAGSSRNDRHSVALVTWNDPEQNYKQVVEYVEDAELIGKWGIKQAELTAFGCTSRAQAIRAGRWILYTESYESEMINFEVGLDSALVLPGDVIKIQDPSYAGKRLGGRIVEITEKSAVLDADVSLSPSNDSVISIMMPDGKFVERDVIVSYEGPRRKIEWNTPLDKLPNNNAIWMISEASLNPIVARVVNIQQGEAKNTFKIMAVAHEPRKYDLIEKGIRFEKRPTTTDIRDVSAPTECHVEEKTTAVGLGYVRSSLFVSWLGGANCISYELMWRRENENETDWETIYTKSKYLTLENVQRGMYHFKLRGVGLVGNKSAEVEFYHSATGQYVTPLDVTEFKVIKRPSYLDIRWKPVKLAASYEVRCGESWDVAQVVTAGATGSSTVHFQYEAGTYLYHIRSISQTGEYSANVTTFKLVLNAPAMPVDLTAIVAQSRIDFTWRSNKEDDLSHYELREGSSWAAGTKVAESKVNQMSIPAGSEVERTFWLKAIALPKIYSNDAAWIKINVTSDTRRNIIITHSAKPLQWPGNMIHMHRTGDDVIMNEGENRAEYIHEMNLPSEINAQNSFFTNSTVTVMSGDDTETWQTAKFPWRSEEAQRAWRLGGDADTLSFENQIARKVGMSNEFEGFSLENTLVSERGVGPSFQTGVSYDWGRYRKGLVVGDMTGVSWNGEFVNPAFGSAFRMSFWAKPQALDENISYQIVKIGNGAKSMKIIHNTVTDIYTLLDKENGSIDIKYESKPNRYMFFGISQGKHGRTFAVCALGGKPIVKSMPMPEIGGISRLDLGTQID